ncbi:MAG: hypothetical protein EPO68_01045 [Planctomycetota bacterium]|nr:MAG: hypothetical protein EPO68_01045 [Planctomycetota bacterium]
MLALERELGELAHVERCATCRFPAPWPSVAILALGEPEPRCSACGRIVNQAGQAIESMHGEARIVRLSRVPDDLLAQILATAAKRH